MRRWRKILVIGVCGILALIAGVLVWDALTTKPVLVRLPDGTTLSFYATTYGTNQERFPAPNPMKRFWARGRLLTASAEHRLFLFGRPNDGRTGYWWFKSDPPMSFRGQTLWSATVTTNHLSLYIPSQIGCGRLGDYTQPQIVGIEVRDCPTNMPTLIMSFTSHRETPDNHIVDVHFITNITVPNPAYHR